MKLEVMETPTTESPSRTQNNKPKNKIKKERTCKLERKQMKGTVQEFTL